MRTSSFRIFGLIVLGVVGGIIFSSLPVVGSVFIIFGLLGSLVTLLSADSKFHELEGMQLLHSELLIKSGAGNSYAKAFQKDVKKHGCCANGEEYLRKACELDPDDFYSVINLAGVLALQLASRQSINHDDKTVNRAEILEVKNLCQRAHKLNPQSPNPHVARGIILDVEGCHSVARREFTEAGRLGHPDWHLYMSVSWRLEGNETESLEEIKKAIETNADCHWSWRFQYGCSLLHAGKYHAALRQLLCAYRVRGSRPELLDAISSAYFHLGHMCISAMFLFVESITVIRSYPKLSIQLFFGSILKFFIGLYWVLSKVIWSVAKHIPLVRNLLLHIISPIQPEATLSFILWERGHYNLALKHAKKTTQLCPYSGNRWAHLAGLYMVLGRKEDSLKAIDRALDLQPENPLFQHGKEQFLAIFRGCEEDIRPLPKNVPKKYMKGWSFKEIDVQ